MDDRWRYGSTRDLGLSDTDRPRSVQRKVGLLTTLLTTLRGLVVRCYLQGAHQAFPPDRRLPRSFRITMRIGEPLRFTEMSDDKEGWRNIAQQLEERVRKLGAVDSIGESGSWPEILLPNRLSLSTIIG